MISKTITASAVALSLAVIPATKVSADAGDFVAGAIIGGIVGHAATKNHQRKRATTRTYTKKTYKPRLPSTQEQDPAAGSGYVHEDYVRAAAAAAGFVFDGSSEVNANIADTADHPFGVWTLPPNSRTSDRDGNAPEGFDPAPYLEIGESDRMTLKFIKPAE